MFVVKQKTAYEMRISDWSSDVCSSDLADMAIGVKDKDEDRKAYFAEAESWDRDRFLAAVRSRRVAWIVAIVAIVFAAICAAAVLALSPLKTVVPYVVTVDRSTGATEVTQELRGD